jgi:pimeloyl-ACP methyl ester carboxylesterase
MRIVLVIGVLFVVVGTIFPIQPTSADQGTDSFIPTFEPADCQFKIPMGERVDCGYLTVPEVRSIEADAPDFRTIRLHVAHFHSHNPDPPADPIIYLVGGPAVSIFIEMDSSFYHFAALLDNRDVYVFDQRGIGYSEPALQCPPSRINFYLESISDCRDDLTAQGINLSGYTTTESAADVADLRLALDIDEWNVVGVSYGTRLAMAVLRDNDAGVRSVIIDSVLPLGDSDFSQFSGRGAYPDIFDQIYADCAADTACNAAYPDLHEAYQTVFQELRDNPVRQLDQWDFEFIVGRLLGATDTAQLVPYTIYNIYRDRERLLDPEPIHSTYTTYDGMSLSVNCADGMNGGAVCSTWGVRFDQEAAARSIESEVPILILSGAYDSITPTYGAQLMDDMLPNSNLFEIPFTSHGVIRSGGDCPQSMAFAFLDDPTEWPDAGCIEEMQARFYVE